MREQVLLQPTTSNKKVSEAAHAKVSEWLQAHQKDVGDEFGQVFLTPSERTVITLISGGEVAAYTLAEVDEIKRKEYQEKFKEKTEEGYESTIRHHSTTHVMAKASNRT